MVQIWTILGPYVVQIWTRNFDSIKPSKSTEWMDGRGRGVPLAAAALARLEELPGVVVPREPRCRLPPRKIVGYKEVRR